MQSAGSTLDAALPQDAMSSSPAEDEWEVSTSTSSQQPGPAEAAARAALGWHDLCGHVSRFASTTLGRRTVLNDLPLGGSEAESLKLAAGARVREKVALFPSPNLSLHPLSLSLSLSRRPAPSSSSLSLFLSLTLTETAAASFIEGELGRELEFGGVSTASAASALTRAARGGLLSGPDLSAVASLAAGATRLAGAVRAAARAAEGMEIDGEATNPAAPLAKPFDGFDGAALKGLVREVATAIDEGGAVRDNASEALRTARLGVRTAAARARAAVKSAGGEVVERAGRFCVGLPDGAVPPRGAVLLGSSGGLAFYEPASAVAPNNALAAAAGQAASAEENVRWALTGGVADAAPLLRRALSLVVWADVTAARSRYGVWTGGILADFVPVGGGRGGGGSGGSGKGGRGARVAAARARRAGGPPTSTPPATDGGDGDGAADADAPYHVQLFQYRHPLLLGTHLIAAEAATRRARAGGAGAAAAAAAAGSALRSLSTRRRGGGGRAGGAAASAAPTPPELPPPPVPIDLAIKAGVRGVIITGPNTGGKTAALKALGLAALSARAGLPLPARAPARLPWFAAILADIGDGQSLGAGLSTFGGHLARVTALRKEAGPDALVLLDELGTGTDPAEGAALGAALLAALAAGGMRGAGLTLATTHAASLAELKAAQPGLFENAAAEFDAVALAPTHRLLWGLPGRSCGLDIAERLGLDADVVADARARLAGRNGAPGSSTLSSSPSSAVQGGAAEALDAARRAAEADADAATAAQASAAAARASASSLRASLAASAAAVDLETAASVGRAADAAAAELKRRATRRRKSGGDGGATSSSAAPIERPAIKTPRGTTRVMGANAGRFKKGGAAAGGRLAGRGPPPGWSPAVGDTVSVPRLKLVGKVVGVQGKQVTVSAGGLLGRASVGVGECEWAGR